MKVYTKTGDKGETSLVGGSRVRKNDLRLECYGTIDELNSHIGLLLAYIQPNANHTPSTQRSLTLIQNLLFNIGGYLACEPNTPYYKKGCIIESQGITFLEQQIDSMQQSLPITHQFILPQGGISTAQAHVCRTIVRRAERLIVSLSSQEEVDPLVLEFTNRLSDYFFILARFLQKKEHGDEFFWKKDCFSQE